MMGSYQTDKRIVFSCRVNQASRASLESPVPLGKK